MSAKIVTVVNQKGGSGKTTISMQLGGSMALLDYKVLIVDADPQATATRWSSSSSEESPFPASVIGLSAAGKSICKEIKKFIFNYDYIFVDCPPAIESDIPQSVLLISDLALVPIIPSPADLWASVGISKLIGFASNLNESLRSRIVVNLCQTNTSLSKDVIDAMREIDIPLLKTIIFQRNAFRKSSGYGQTVHFLGKEAEKAIKEIDNLTKEILNIIN